VLTRSLAVIVSTAFVGERLTNRRLMRGSQWTKPVGMNSLARL